MVLATHAHTIVDETFFVLGNYGKAKLTFLVFPIRLPKAEGIHPLRKAIQQKMRNNPTPYQE
jgi:hypothetical protein